jgi:hypothetical protein
LEPRTRKRKLLLAIVFIAIISGGTGGYVAYDKLWANNPVWNAALDQPFASRAVDSLSIICVKSGNDNHVYEPNNATAWFVLGIRNRSGYPMQTKWTVDFNFTTVETDLSSSQTFGLLGNGDAYPKFTFTANSTQLVKIRSDSSPTQDPVFSIIRVFNVTGYHASYHITRYDSATPIGPHTGFLGVTIGGDVGKILGPPPCP